MNQAQTAILWCAVAIAAAACLFPPWVLVGGSTKESVRTLYGWHPLFSPPLTPEQKKEVRRCEQNPFMQLPRADAMSQGAAEPQRGMRLSEAMAQGAPAPQPATTSSGLFDDLIPTEAAGEAATSAAPSNPYRTGPLSVDQTDSASAADAKRRNPFADLFSKRCKPTWNVSHVNVAIDLTRLGLELFVVALVGTAAFLTAGRSR